VSIGKGRKKVWLRRTNLAHEFKEGIFVKLRWNPEGDVLKARRILAECLELNIGIWSMTRVRRGMHRCATWDGVVLSEANWSKKRLSSDQKSRMSGIP